MTHEAEQRSTHQVRGVAVLSAAKQVDDLLTPRQVNDDYGFSPQTLANWRWLGVGPDFIKTNPSKSGRVRYRRSSIERWLDAQTVSTSGGAAV